jgi:hypothetical protein
MKGLDDKHRRRLYSWRHWFSPPSMPPSTGLEEEGDEIQETTDLAKQILSPDPNDRQRAKTCFTT